MKGPTKPAPPGWPRISSALYYDDAETAIDWLCNAFGFMVRLKVAGDDGSIVHSELEYGDGLIMVGQTGRGGGDDVGQPREVRDEVAGGGEGGAAEEDQAAWRANQASPVSLGARNTQSLCVYVDDVDAHCARARAAGAQVFREPTTTDYGGKYWTDRSYGALDPEGHMWWFMQRMRTAGE
jgi:uncharacterized glyoxalase superfamily protein PhnB